MKISLSWLKEFVPFEGSVESLTALLIRAGLEVESVETTGADFPQVVVGQILESNPHPNADRLSVCRVDDGSGHPRQIVCGAKNYKVGDKVPLALPGAVLPGDFKIKSGKLRGVESDGMMCSAKELNLPGDAAGLLILPESAQVGSPISSAIPADTLLELEITSNRPDWLSHRGIAREVAAFTGASLKTPEVSPTDTVENGEMASVSDPEACPFYTVRRLNAIQVGPSPDWLKTRIEACGLRSINNVVDVTNYVMLELGQPLHAFDAAKVDGPLVVRNAREAETLLTLDGQTLALKTDDLVIADSKGPLALAGVMGGIASGVSATTKDVLLESAYFDAPRIRKAARTHGLQTDSSYRFERGVDPSGVLTASSRAADLILQVAGGDLAPYAVRVGTPLPTSHEVELSPARCRALLGLNLADSEIRTLLENLGFECLASDAEDQRWNVPSSRADLTRDVDLIEEVIRLAGIERVVGRIRAVPSASSMADAAYDEMMSVRHFLAGAGFSEARTSTLVSRTSGAGRPVLEVRNPLGDDQSALRPTLLSGLLGAVGRNLNQGAASVRLFEIGRVFTVSHEEEQTMVGLVSTGFRSTKSWIESSESAIDMYDLKGVLEKLAPGSSFAAVEAVAPFAAAYQIQTGGFVVGLLGILSPAAAREMNARGPVVAAEIRLDAIASSASVTSAFQPLAKFPAVTRDLALVVPKSTSWGEIEAVVKGTDEPLLTDVRVFDVFADPTGEKLAADRKSLAFSLTFRAAERTLTSDEVSAVFDRIKARVKSALPVEFRE